MARAEFSLITLLKQLHSDFSDKLERQYYGLWLINQVPCGFGDMLRSNYCSKRLKKAGCNLRIMAGVRFRSLECLEVGDNVTISQDSFIQARGGVTIGNNVLMGPGVRIWSTNHVYMNRNITICKQGLVNKPVVIGNDIWLGSAAFVAPGVVLPDGVVVAAGSILTNKTYEPYSIYAGNPARIIGSRN
jgi:acetyltransferase-like isoleucine patch superfamily enzyme